MGYYTDYHIQVSSGNGGGGEEDASPFFEAISPDDYDPSGGWGYVYSAKWYECETEIAEASKLIPNSLVTVVGRGEIFDDCWTMYVKNGKSVTHHLSFLIPPFNEGDLK